MARALKNVASRTVSNVFDDIEALRGLNDSALEEIGSYLSGEILEYSENDDFAKWGDQPNLIAGIGDRLNPFAYAMICSVIRPEDFDVFTLTAYSAEFINMVINAPEEDMPDRKEGRRDPEGWVNAVLLELKGAYQKEFASEIEAFQEADSLCDQFAVPEDYAESTSATLVVIRIRNAAENIGAVRVVTECLDLTELEIDENGDGIYYADVVLNDGGYSYYGIQLDLSYNCALINRVLDEYGFEPRPIQSRKEFIFKRLADAMEQSYTRNSFTSSIISGILDEHRSEELIFL